LSKVSFSIILIVVGALAFIILDFQTDRLERVSTTLKPLEDSFAKRMQTIVAENKPPNLDQSAPQTEVDSPDALSATTNLPATATPSIEPEARTQPVTQAEAISTAERKLAALQGECAAKLGGLYASFKKEKDTARRKQLISTGFSGLAACNGRFEGIMGELSGQLQQLGVDPGPYVASYRSQYAAVKQSEMSKLD
jgi:hypothetical protein